MNEITAELDREKEGRVKDDKVEMHRKKNWKDTEQLRPWEGWKGPWGEETVNDGKKTGGRECV